MFIKLPVRWVNQVLDEDKLEDYQQSQSMGMVSKPPIKEEELRGHAVVDLLEIKHFHSHKGDTILRMSTGDVFCVTIPLADFEQIWIKISGKSITNVEAHSSSGSDILNSVSWDGEMY